MLVSAFFVQSETGKDITIKTICSGHSIHDPASSPEDAVVKVSERRAESNVYEYLTTFGDGTESWWEAGIFFDEDGTCTQAFLEFSTDDDLQTYLMYCTQKNLHAYCVGLSLKAGGNKTRLCKRLKKFYRLQVTKSTSLASKFEDALGPIQDGEASISGRVRRFYTNNYSALDRFDSHWYRIEYPLRIMSWENYYTFSLLQQSVVNAYVAYCKLVDEKIPILSYIKLVVDLYGAERTGEQ
jgi:hypothetical protein